MCIKHHVTLLADHFERAKVIANCEQSLHYLTRVFELRGAVQHKRNYSQPSVFLIIIIVIERFLPSDLNCDDKYTNKKLLIFAFLRVSVERLPRTKETNVSTGVLSLTQGCKCLRQVSVLQHWFWGEQIGDIHCNKYVTTEIVRAFNLGIHVI